MTVITSLVHEDVKRVVRLHTTAGRKKEGLFIVEGALFIESFKQHGYMLIAIYATEKAYEKNPLSSEHVHYVSEHVMKKMSQATTPSGYLAIFKKPTDPNFNFLSSGIVLAQIQDPGNMGTLIRSTAAFGYKSVVVVEGCDPFSYKVIQATAGTLPLVNLFVCDWQTLLKNKNGLKLVGLTVQNGKDPKNFNKYETLFVVGNEAHGLPQEWIVQCHDTCTLPMKDSVESLNAAVAGSLVLALTQYE